MKYSLPSLTIKKFLSLVAGLLLGSSFASSQIVGGGLLGQELVIENSGSASTTSFTVDGANNNRGLIVAVGGEVASDFWASAGATWNSQPMTLVTSEYGANFNPGTGIFWLANPDGGNQTLAFTGFAISTGGEFSVATYSIWNVEQSTPTIVGSNFVDETTGGTPNAIDLGTVAANGFAVDVMSTRQTDSTNMTFTNNQSVVQSLNYFENSDPQSNIGGSSIAETAAGNLTITGALVDGASNDRTAHSAIYVAAIPEPSTALLLSLGLGGVLLLRRRRA